MENALGRNVNISKVRTSWLFMIYAIFTIIAYTLPMLKITLPYIVVALLLLASLVFFMYQNVRWLQFAIILCITSAIVMAINIMTGIYDLVGAMNEMIRNIRFFIPILWGCYAIKNCNEKQKKFVLLIFGVMCVFVLFRTLQAIQEIPDIARELAKSTSRESSMRTSYRMRNVGGFEYSYMMGIITLGFVWSAVKAKSKKLRIISFVAAVVGYYYIIQTMYTLLLILTFVGTILIFFFSTKNTILKVTIVLCCIAIFLFMESTFKTLAEIFSFNYGLHEKFTSMYLAIKFDDVDMVGSRPEMLKSAFENWTQNPIFGGQHIDSNAHSLIMSILENSGIVGFGLWIGFFTKGWQKIKEALKQNNTSTMFFDVAMIYALLLSFFNPIGYVFEIVFAIFFIVPIWSSIVRIDSNIGLRRKKS